MSLERYGNAFSCSTVRTFCEHSELAAWKSSKRWLRASRPRW